MNNMRNKNIIKVSMEEWIKNTSYSLVQQNFEIIKEFSKNHDILIFNKLLTVFMGHFIELVITNTLSSTDPDLLSNHDQYEYVSKNFKELKTMMQLQIAESFSKSMNEFSDIDCDYYCEIKLIPEPINKIEC
jgi:hypothetical protein